MDRRDFIRRGALGASGAVVGGGLPEEAKAQPAAPVVAPPADMDEYVRGIDAALDRLSEWPLAQSFPHFDGDSDQLNELGRKALHSLYVTGMFGDLPVDKQVHPAMQDRLWASQQTMDEAYAGMKDFLGTRTPEQLERVRATLRDRPEVLERVIRTVDQQAAASGMSEPRRAQLRTMFTESAWRLKSQPPRLMIDEYLSKVERATASDIESEARQRWLAARYGEEIFWQAQGSLRQRRISRG
ncbi:MAG TPA: twin-arginine translocation signal domain-containing protein, partial [Longimicrobiales bacterium]|nr:twin-arginine translocation signal domain-containing protein [Longimicrobiales bacterium]